MPEQKAGGAALPVYRLGRLRVRSGGCGVAYTGLGGVCG